MVVERSVEVVEGSQEQFRPAAAMWFYQSDCCPMPISQLAMYQTIASNETHFIA